MKSILSSKESEERDLHDYGITASLEDLEMKVAQLEQGLHFANHPPEPPIWPPISLFESWDQTLHIIKITWQYKRDNTVNIKNVNIRQTEFCGASRDI